MPNCAQTGMPARAIGAHGVRKARRAIQLDEVGATLLHESDRRAHRRLGPFLQRTERKVAADERPPGAAANRAAGQHHLVECDLELGSMAPEVDADRVADREHVDAGALGDRRQLILVGDDGDDLLSVALHLL